MRRHTSRLVTAGLAAALGILSIPIAGVTGARAQVDQPVPPYNPYPPLPGSVPPTVLPPDLQTELFRVRREVQTIFDRYFAEWQALTPPVLSNTQGEGNPPILQGTGYDAVRILGGLLNFDENMSPFRNVAIRHRACSSAQTSGMGVRPDTSCRVLTPSRHSIRRSTPGKWRSLIRPASRCGYLRRITDSSLSWFGAPTSTSIGRPTLSRSAPPRQGIFRTPCQLR
jgi:hypothetical protein